MSMVAKVVRSAGALGTVLRNTRWLNPAMEIVYRELFLRDLRRLGIEDGFYPIGSAANHGLLYAITRAFAQFPIRSVLELGCGQSTLLLAALNRRLNEPASIRSVEQDPRWAERLRAAVGHEVVTSELVPKTVRGRAIRHYGDRDEPARLPRGGGGRARGRLHRDRRRRRAEGRGRARRSPAGAFQGARRRLRRDLDRRGEAAAHLLRRRVPGRDVLLAGGPHPRAKTLKSRHAPAGPGHPRVLGRQKKTRTPGTSPGVTTQGRVPAGEDSPAPRDLGVLLVEVFFFSTTG